MAPTAPKKRPSIRAKTSKSPSSIHVPPTHRPGAIISDSFINSKKDKRTIKHSAFVNRIEKSHKKPLKRRRPNKKLVTTMESLAYALPDVEELVKGKGLEEVGKVRKSLKSRPGALKRKEKLERGERERFGRNLAQILNVPRDTKEGKAEDMGVEAVREAPAVEVPAAATVPPPPAPASSGRFAVLRAWVNQNMEKHPAFAREN